MTQSSDDPSKRLQDLEVRFAFQEDQIRQLDEVIREQASLIERLQHDVVALREEQKELGGDEAPIEEQVPPHY